MYITGKKIFQYSHLVTQLSILTEISLTSCTQRVFMRGHIVDIYLQDLTFPQYVGTASSIRMNKNSKPKESGQCESAVCTKTVKRASVPSPHSMKWSRLLLSARQVSIQSGGRKIAPCRRIGSNSLNSGFFVVKAGFSHFEPIVMKNHIVPQSDWTKKSGTSNCALNTSFYRFRHVT